jgi:hypothetical protein
VIGLEPEVSSLRVPEPETAAVVGPLAQRQRAVVRRALGWLESQALFVAALAAVAAFSLARVPDHLNQDGWLALVSGRYVANHGIPRHDTLTVMAHGASWIDQQWLAQLAMYGLYVLGGLALYSLVYVALIVIGLAISIAAARDLGASERHVLCAFPLVGFLYLAGSFQIRTQGFAYALFALTLWLLASEARSPERRKRVYLVLPLLVLWGNLHGSVTMGAGLAVLYGVTLLVADLRKSGWRRALGGISPRTLVFLVAPIACLFVTPYGGSIITYYHDTLLNPAFSKLVTEWQPVTSMVVVAIPFFALALATVWLLGRSGRRAPLFDHLALVALAVGGILAVRNITWFALAAAMLVPVMLSTVLASRPAPRRRPLLNLGVAAAALAVVVGLVGGVASKPGQWFERGYDHRAVTTVAAAVKQHPGARIFADVRFGDWLLWEDPGLDGHVAYDARFELLNAHQLEAIATATANPAPGHADTLGPYGLLVLDSTSKPVKRLVLARRGTRILLDGRNVVVAATSSL